MSILYFLRFVVDGSDMSALTRPAAQKGPRRNGVLKPKVSNSEQTTAARVCCLTIGKRSRRFCAKNGTVDAHKDSPQSVDRIIDMPELNCGESGTVHLSQPEGRDCDVIVEAVSAGFKVVRVEFDEAFYGKACNLPTDAKHLD
jgi:hypothetical protein